ncbi:MAG: outer membrane beta-barrel protein, partial [Bacteroidales bacterium]
MNTRLSVVLISLVFLFSISSAVYSQKLIAGIMSGVNFSDIHGELTTGKWQSKPGPVTGLIIGYSFNKIITLQSGLDYSAIYYEYQPYRYEPHPLPFPWEPEYWIYSQIENQKWDFSFFRIPLYLKLNTPTRLQFELGGGAYYSFIAQSETGIPAYFEKPPKNDFGYIFSAGLSYPLNRNLHIFLDGRYISGRRVFIEHIKGKNGATELTFGIGYSGFLKKADATKPGNEYEDSSLYKIWIKYTGGLNVSWIKADIHNKSYSAKAGYSAGISLDYRFDEQFSLQMDIVLERKGYNMKDSSASFYRYLPEGVSMYQVDTKTHINYIVIPLLLNVHFGRTFSVYINTGPYVGLRLNARCSGIATNEYSGEDAYILNQVNVYDDIEGLIRNDDWGWVFGCGIGIPFFKKYNLNFELRYSYGFGEILKPEDSNTN